MTDAMRREALRIRSTGRVSAGSVNGLILSPEEDCLGENGKSLDDVSSEGLWQWNMDKDVEYQYEIFNGLPVYYGGGRIRRIRKSTILWRWHARCMWRIIILMFRREWN